MKTRNYLRVRGEYTQLLLSGLFFMELPPRARRIRGVFYRNIRVLGTTSACAENTFEQVYEQDETGNYLRVRGEYLRGNRKSIFVSELPPRARRIPFWLAFSRSPAGTTSACAENTLNELGLL